MEQLLADLVQAIKSNKSSLPEQVEFGWSDVEILVRVGRFLIQNARKWYDDWSPEVRDWASFKREFSNAFPLRRNLGRLLSEAADYNSSACNTYDIYVHKKTALLHNLRVTWKEDDLVELIVHGISESHVRDAAVSRDCKTVPELLAYLTAFQKKTRDNPTDADSVPSKRPHLARGEHRNRVTCYNCGKAGHLRKDCRAPVRRNHMGSTKIPERGAGTSNMTNKVVCSFCAKPGHTPDKCFTKNAIEQRLKVNFCTAGNPVIPSAVIVDGRQFLGLVDTGSDVSLICERFRSMFINKIEFHQVVIKGISPETLKVNEQFTAEVEINGEKTSLVLIIVPDQVLDFDVLIGCNLYRDAGLASLTDHSGTRVFRKQIFDIHRVIESTAEALYVYDAPSQYAADVTSVMNLYPELATTGFKVPAIKTATLSIRLTDSHVVNRSPTRLSVAERAAVRDIIRELLANDIIRESESPYASPILLVRKKDDTYRMCVDYRELNSHTIKDRYPLPLIEDQLDRLGKGKFFTSLDMASGFHQVPISEDSIEKTALVTPDGHYDYLRMPFRLANAPAVYQRALINALGPLKDSIALVYLDDILIPSQTPEEGIGFLKQVLDALRIAGFSLNINKCKFLQSKILYLGREISAEGIRPDPRKISALVDAPVPRSPKQVRQFMIF